MSGLQHTDPDFRCASESLLRREPVAGTASSVRSYLLLEHPGSWGTDALRDARLPDGLGSRLSRVAALAGVRVLLVRRCGRRPDGAGRRVFAASADPHNPRLESATLTDLRDVLDLDLGRFRATGTVGLEEHAGPLFCVCTHGRHDACCAERGRPVAQALSRARPEETWEVSHIGGDRFAGNLLVLPHGLYYGRLDPESALTLADAQLRGELDLARLRGRSGFAMPVQFAEIALRLELVEPRDAALRLVSRTTDGDRTEAVFEGDSGAYAVTVRSVPGGEPHRLTCRATRENPGTEHELLTIVRR